MTVSSIADLQHISECAVVLQESAISCNVTDKQPLRYPQAAGILTHSSHSYQILHEGKGKLNLRRSLKDRSIFLKRDLIPRQIVLYTLCVKFESRVFRFYETHPGVREVPGTSETFARLRRAGIKIAVDTSFSREIVQILLDRLGWQRDGLIDASTASDEVPRGRPHPDMIRRLIRRSSLGSRRCRCPSSSSLVARG